MVKVLLLAVNVPLWCFYNYFFSPPPLLLIYSFAGSALRGRCCDDARLPLPKPVIWIGSVVASTGTAPLWVLLPLRRRVYGNNPIVTRRRRLFNTSIVAPPGTLCVFRLHVGLLRRSHSMATSTESLPVYPQNRKTCVLDSNTIGALLASCRHVFPRLAYQLPSVGDSPPPKSHDADTEP